MGNCRNIRNGIRLGSCRNITIYICTFWWYDHYANSSNYLIDMMDFLIQKAYAAGPPGGATAFDTLLQKILTNIVNPVIYLIMALAVVYFVWGVMIFIQNADKSEKREEGYKHMIWGIVGIFIMVSAKGIINIIISTMGL
ncbi:MAG: hypothetical protein C0412_20165 [Flavobacterium sp.]|nr:hypothetical protein [Flavobacterium sp.]